MARIRLSTLERLRLLDMLPQQGSIATIRVLRRLRETLSFSEKEHEEMGIKVDGQSIRWKETIEKDFELGMMAREMIREAIQRANAGNCLPMDLMGLVEKFCPEMLPKDSVDDEARLVSDGASESSSETIVAAPEPGTAAK